MVPQLRRLDWDFDEGHVLLVDPHPNLSDVHLTEAAALPERADFSSGAKILSGLESSPKREFLSPYLPENVSIFGKQDASPSSRIGEWIPGLGPESV